MTLPKISRQALCLGIFLACNWPTEVIPPTSTNKCGNTLPKTHLRHIEVQTEMGKPRECLIRTLQASSQSFTESDSHWSRIKHKPNSGEEIRKSARESIRIHLDL